MFAVFQNQHSRLSTFVPKGSLHVAPTGPVSSSSPLAGSPQPLSLSTLVNMEYHHPCPAVSDAVWRRRADPA